MDVLSEIAFWIELAAAVLVIAGVVVVLLVVRDSARRAKQTLSTKTGSIPTSVVTMSEHLRRMGARPLCFVNDVEIRTLYARVMRRPIPTSQISTESSSRAGNASLGVGTTSVGAARSSTATSSTEFEGAHSEQLCEEIIAKLLDSESIALGLESLLPETDRLDALNHAMRLFAKADAEPFVDRKGLLAHRQRLEAGGSASRDAKAHAITEAHARYNYIAIVGDFLISGGQDLDGHPDQPPKTIVLSVCGVDIAVRIPLTEVKADWRPSFEGAGTIERLMVFGQIGPWQANPPRLTIHPLIVAPNWVL